MRFKKILSGTLCAAMMLGAMAGCTSKPAEPTTPTPPAADALFTAGKFTGEGQGYGGAIKVEVEVDEQKIIAVTVVEHKETAGISDPALAKIPAGIVEAQSLAVETVAGCTLASQGILDAATAALTLTCKDMSKLQKAVEAAPVSTDTITKSADIVIVGAGGAGMSAAVEAIRAGKTVLIVEKMPAIGGNTILAGSAYNTSDPELQKKQEMSKDDLARIEGILATAPKNDIMKGWQATLQTEIDAYKAAGSTYLFDSPSLHKLQTYMDGDYVGNPEIISIMCDNSLEGTKFLTELGTEWLDQVNAAVGATWMRSHTPTTKFGAKGASFVTPQANFVKENGGELMLDAKVEELVLKDGKCVGVKGKTTAGQPFEISANKNVILATGGFGANVEMREKYNTHWATLDANVPTSNGPQATGDGIVMAEAIGANLIGMEWIQLLPTSSAVGGVWTPYIENQFYINHEGNRFVKEDGRRDELSKAILEQTGAELFIISDANTVINGVTTTGTKVDEEKIGQGNAWKADTLEDLAKQIGVPYEALQASVDQYNNSVANGNDPFGRTVFDQPFGKAPFYAGLTKPAVHHTMGGVEINTNTQVLNKDGQVIEGLYACGEVTGGVHGANRLGGNAIADITVFGRIAGQQASK